jgi:hypothetical protein
MKIISLHSMVRSQMKKATTCLYNSVMTFSITGSIMKLELDNKGQTYYNGSLRVVVMVYMI